MQTEGVLHFPIAGSLTIALVAGAVLLFFGGAAMFEFSRRRERARKHRLREWGTVHEIFHERGIAEDDAALLEDWLSRHAGREPARAITTRDGFEKLIAAGLDRARKLEPKKRRNGAAESLEDLGVRLHKIRAELGLDRIAAGASIASTRELSEGQWMSIARADATPPQWFRVMIEGVNEASLHIGYKDGPPSTAPSFPANTPVRCSLWRGDDARYTFDTTIAATNGAPTAWALSHTANLHRTQTRAHYRIHHDQPVIAEVLSAPANAAAPADLLARPVVTRIDGRISSLSAGGCAIVFKQSVTRHVLLKIPLRLAARSPLSVAIEIVSTAHISGGRHLVRGKFLGLTEDQQDTIARYIHYKQQRPAAPH